ncbi:cysteine hydrolase [Mycobacterium sp. smrl_JER01]|uniref:cysteine hydrolase n=1 Tax=Mycobacterium sp. smrl_JER01 TaxID=3402633 RepID=UPI003ACA0C0D
MPTGQLLMQSVVRHLTARLTSRNQDESESARHYSGFSALQELDPRECALLVLGCQASDFDDHVDSLQTLNRISAAVDAIRRLCGEVIFSPLALDSLERQIIPPTNREFSALALDRRFQHGAPCAEIHPAVGVRPDDAVVRRTRLGAFATTELDIHLTNCGVTTLFISGVETSGAVLSTVREAADRDYRLILLADCISDCDTAKHQLLFEQIFPRQAEITTADILARQLRRNSIAMRSTTA